MGWNLTDIINKVRATTSRPDTSMMTDDTIVTYINNYYQYVLPKELKIFWGSTYYQFFSQPNVDQYIAPSDFQTLNPQVWADGWPLCWYISPDTFYQDWPQQLNKSVVSTADGFTNNFNFSIPAFPIIPGSLYVTDGTSSNTAVDNGLGGFIAPASGTINYATGQVSSLIFGTIPSANSNITQSSQTYMAARPQAILFYKSKPLLDATATVLATVNMFVLRPVPDDVYLIKMEAIQVPPAFDITHTSGGIKTDVPFRVDLGPLIAFGASLEIFSDFNQQELYHLTLPQYQRYKNISMQDTYEEYIYQRSVPAF